MFAPWITVVAWLKQRTPSSLKALAPHANFITLHYAYIIGWTLIGSVILYGGGRIDYIDALFFASGSATQSGLNTIDINTLALYQQITMYLMTSLCTPIFIHSSVVVVRLYWFEKRFQNIVLERGSRSGRTRTLSRRKSEMQNGEDRDVSHEEKAVGAREIRVMRGSNGHAHGGHIENEFAFSDGMDSTGNGIRARRRSSSSEDEMPPFVRPTTPVRNTSAIVWADNLSTPKARDEDRKISVEESPGGRLPQSNKEKSIAFVEAQRNPTARNKLRIPGPRDFDQGLIPEAIKGDDEELDRVQSRPSHDSHPRPRFDRSNSLPHAANGDDRPFKNHITIDVPDRVNGPTGHSIYDRTGTVDGDAGPTPGMHLRNRSRSRTIASFLSRSKDEDEEPVPYLSWTPTIGRNSNFVDLTEEQREELGGIEYRALKLLVMILTVFYLGWHTIGIICLVPWITHTARYSGVVEAVGINPVWWGFFTSASLFNDLGFTLTPDSMVSFQLAVFPLIIGTFLIIIGNTGFPCMLRFTIWMYSKMVPKTSSLWEELRFLLDHPRRCFTLLFPSKANWWLFWILVVLNGVDLIFFIILDLGDPTVTSLSPGHRFLAGLFQAASTRTAGFAVVNIADLHPAVQVSYMIMMYISIFPIAMSIRQSNVYEEKSLGVWASSGEEEEENSSYLSHHLRLQLSFDLWFVFLGFFLIAIIEGARLENTNEYAFSLFSVLFEIVSAYGTVGLSQGFPGVNTSFSGQFKPLSKLIIIAMQIRGRHRGLPYALDRAILLPSETLHQKENEDATRRARRSSTAVDMSAGMPDGLSRTTTGISRRSTASGDRMGQSSQNRPKQLKRILSGAFSAGPTGQFKRA